jgi:hypothetical protein
VRTGDEDLADGQSLPSEDFTVARLRRRFGSQSHVGMLYTRRDALGLIAPFDDRHTLGTDLTLATPNFLGDYNIDSTTWFVHTTKLPDLPGGSNAYGWDLNFPNDPWDARVGFNEFQEAYDAAVGFTPRRNFRQWDPSVRFSPRLDDHPAIRGFDFEVETEIVTDLQNQLITRDVQFAPFGVEFHSGDEVELQFFRTTENLETDFEIEDGIVLPMGSQYAWTRYQIGFRAADQRPLSGEVEYSDGGFWSGTRREIGIELTARPRRGVSLQFAHEYNDVDLPEGSFVTRLYRLDARTQFNPWISVANNVQYDSESRIIGWQMRFRWILKPGDDIFFVYTQNWLDERAAGATVLDRRGALKVVRTWRF